MSYIKIKDVKKSFKNKKGSTTEVLKGIDLEIEQGDIYGIIGYSGAGKSTLIRCINGLEKADSGSITIEGSDITTLNEKQLMSLRLKIGMIFQHFNLLRSKNVYDNIALPLKYQKYSADRIDERVNELLETVGLTDKKRSYPSQLSGGQKQRVAIARALAVKP
ncbi:MAG: ATP-binding cassette domain-containing protein, partial [Lachnospiraceae bacterium]|nr:ATP-binding cassette domain-containing protein [Lachnospiraceae bacterium]